ncbi:MAG: hypothetical protein HQL24_06555 [Candidatus Omnitrophica bacterium]|nr:hypothetical protein [Candidatus Omnitrophota bacterium]
MKLILKILFLLCLSLVLIPNAPAETIHLKNGTTLEGKIIEQNDSYIKIDTGRNIFQIKLNKIASGLPEAPTKEPLPKAPEPEPQTPAEQPKAIEPPAPVVTAPTSQEPAVSEPLREPVLTTTNPPEVQPQQPPVQNIAVDAEDLKLEEDCIHLWSHLDDCTPYRCALEDQMVKGFFSEYTIYGIRNNACYWKQTLPNHGVMRCSLSEETRKKIALDLKANTPNTPALDEAFTNGQCHIAGYEQ